MLSLLIDSLCTLELFGLFSLSHVTLDALRQHCTRLRTLNLGQCYKVQLTLLLATTSYYYYYSLCLSVSVSRRLCAFNYQLHECALVACIQLLYCLRVNYAALPRRQIGPVIIRIALS